MTYRIITHIFDLSKQKNLLLKNENLVNSGEFDYWKRLLN